MPKMTPEQEAAYALDFGVARGDLREQAQLAYDRLVEQRAHPIAPAPLAQGAATPATAAPLASGPAAIGAAPMTVHPGQIRPGRGWYWLALVVILLGFAWAAAVLVLAIVQVDSFLRVPVWGGRRPDRLFGLPDVQLRFPPWHRRGCRADFRAGQVPGPGHLFPGCSRRAPCDRPEPHRVDMARRAARAWPDAGGHRFRHRRSR
jgi:hypothetical protein